MFIISTPWLQTRMCNFVRDEHFLDVTSVADWAIYLNLSLLYLLFPNGVVENKEDLDVV